MEERLDRIEKEMAEDPMAQLENQTTDAKVEMDILDKLQDIRTRNARTERADVDAVLDRVNAVDYLDAEARAELEKKQQEDEEDEAEVRRVFGKIQGGSAPAHPGPSNNVSSIELNEELDPADAMPDQPSNGDNSPAPSASSSNTNGSTSVKRRLEDVEPDATSFLTAEQKKFSSSGGNMPPPPLSKKKRNEAMASKLGIKRKG